VWREALLKRNALVIFPCNSNQVEYTTSLIDNLRNCTEVLLLYARYSSPTGDMAAGQNDKDCCSLELQWWKASKK
jgi:hypothetical protein